MDYQTDYKKKKFESLETEASVPYSKHLGIYSNVVAFLLWCNLYHPLRRISRPQSDDDFLFSQNIDFDSSCKMST